MRFSLGERWSDTSDSSPSKSHEEFAADYYASSLDRWTLWILSPSLFLFELSTRALPSKIDLSDRSPLTRRGRIVWKMVGTAFLRECPSRQCSIHVPSHRFTESRFTQCYVTLATHLSFEAVRTPRIVHHASLTLFSLPRPLTDPPFFFVHNF